MLDPIAVHFASFCGPDNPGGAGGWAFVVKEGDKIIGQGAGRLEPAPTNTDMSVEYHALFEAFDWIFKRHLQGEHVRFYSSKRVLINQMSDVWDVDQKLGEVFALAKNKARKFRDIGFNLATKAQNAEAISLARDAMRPSPAR